jgi:uncharacterized protein
VSDGGVVRMETSDFNASAVSAPFWVGLAAGQLRLPRCATCGSVFFYPRKYCPSCWSGEIEWTLSAGRGTVYTACEVNVPFDGRPADEVPYTVALVDLDEGVRLAARLEGGGMTTIGSRVAISFGSDPAHTLPIFRLEV